MNEFLISPLFRSARSARTCSRRCRRPSMIDILCTAFWVLCRVIRTSRCSQLHVSFVFDSWLKGLEWWSVIGLVGEHVGSGGSRFSESSLETKAPCNCFTIEYGRSWNFEVHVLLFDFTTELVVRVEWRSFTMFFRSMLFFDCTCCWAVTLIRLPWSIWRTEFSVKTLFHWSHENGTFHL